MAKWRIPVITLILALFSVLAIWYFTTQANKSGRPIFSVPDDGYFQAWIKGGRAIIYFGIVSVKDKEWELTRYDLDSKESQKYTMPSLEPGCDYCFSPDGSRIAYTGYIGYSMPERFHLFNIISQREEMSFDIPRAKMAWLNENDIMLFSDNPGIKAKPILLDTKTHKQLTIKKAEAYEGKASIDGDGFAYRGEDGWHYYTIASGKDKLLPIPRDMESGNLLVVSRSSIFYGPYCFGQEGTVYRLDLASMRSEPFMTAPPLPPISTTWSIAPDLKHYCVKESGGGDWYNSFSKFTVYRR